MPEIRVNCDLTDCIHFKRHADEPRAAFCTHPEKHLYMIGASCPLYKRQWNAGREKELRERFLKRKNP